jgi:DNA mismatch repair protein MutL
MPIRILPSEIASQIAAGEVIERPASVVKELVENALDANADFISIKILDAGRTLIEVSDNGCGIPSDELPLSVERHATSKLERAEDLFNIKTLGFRGEALASIGSISRMSLTTHTSDSEMGSHLYVEAGEIHTPQPSGGPIGTVVKVENLFFNVPARMKFLKSEQNERRLIDNLVMRYALAYPNVRFQLSQENRKSLQTPGNGKQREILSAIYGPDVARQLLDVIYKDDLLAILGFISPTSITRSNRREIHFFINGRPIQDTALSTALIKGFHTYLMVGRYPMAILFLELSPETVDVNVHPTKAEVRFREPSRVFASVQNAVRRALLAYNPVPDMPSRTWGNQLGWNTSGAETGFGWDIHLIKKQDDDQDDDYWNGDEQNAPGSGLTGVALPTQVSIPNQRVPILRPIGQVANTYIIAEGPDGLYLIDQHAAHERVLFERLQSQMIDSVPSQSLLEAIQLELPSAEARLLEEQIPIINKIGFSVELFGPQTFIIRSIPALLADGDPAAALRSLVENFEEDETPLQNKQEQLIIARICKRSAVKAGTVLSDIEQRTLVQDLESCRSPRTCPHGRPTMIYLSVDLLERQFGRRGAR